jgi:hypothetical protein
MNEIDLVAIYKGMDKEKLDEEIHALFEIVYALLEALECDSLESFPNTNIKLTVSCEVIKDGSSAAH